MKLIGFTGPAGSGKTTMAKQFDNSCILSFAQPLKVTIGNLFDFKPYHLYTPDGKETIDPRYGVSPRVIMQRFATEFVRSTVPDLWIIKMRAAIKHAINNPFNEFILVDDIRFEDEAALIREFGGTVVHIVGRNEVKLPRWWEFWKKKPHASELPIAVQKDDWMIDNSGELETVPLLVESLICELQKDC